MTRTILTIVGLAVAVAAITTMYTLTWGYATSAKSFYSSRGVDIVIVRAGVSNRLSSNLRADVVDRIRKLPGVERADGSLTEMVTLGESHLFGMPLRGYMPDSTVLSDLSIRDGHPIDGNAKGQVMLGAGLADALGKKPGQQVTVEEVLFEISGVFYGDNPFDSNSLIASVVDVEQLMGRKDIITEVQVRASDAARTETALTELCAEIEALKNEQGDRLGLNAQRTSTFVNTASEARLGRGMATATMAIVITLSFIGMLNTMLMSVMERMREIAVLRAIGWRRSRIIRMIVSEGVVLGLAGALLGNLVAIVAIMALRQFPLTRVLIPRDVSPEAVLIAVATVILATVAGSLYPSLQAASTAPVESLRYE